MSAQRWLPDRRLSQLEKIRHANRIINEMFRPEEDRPSTNWMPRVDISEFDDKYVFEVELPGLDKDDVKLELHERMLNITGEKKTQVVKDESNYHIVERQHGKFCRSFQLPLHANPEGIKADFKNGLLSITLPKVPEAKPKQIEISIQ